MRVFFDPARDVDVTGIVVDGVPMVRLMAGVYADPVPDDEIGHGTIQDDHEPEHVIDVDDADVDDDGEPEGAA